MSLSVVMNQAKGALAASQTGLATTSNNVSNVNTEGYSKQRVDMGTNPPMEIAGRNQVGGGVLVKSINRSHSQFLARRLENESTNLGKLEGMADSSRQLENIFKNEGENGIAKAVGQFFNDLRSLSTQPDSIPLRSAIKESAANLTNRFSSVSSNIRDVVTDIDAKVEGSVAEINSFTTRIASLNRRVMELTARGVSPNAELDDRDLAVEKLSKIVGIQVSPLENGGINVSSGRLGVLVSGTEQSALMTARGGDGVNVNSMRVMVLPSENSQKPVDLTDTISEGALGGYIKLRDETIPAIREKIDTMAFELARSVNSVHQQGFTKEGVQGLSFFQELGSVEGAAENFKVDDRILNNVANIAAAGRRNSPGDNQVLLKMADVQDARIFNEGTANVLDFNSSLVGEMGIQTRSINDSLNIQQDMMQQLSTLREEASGVSLDEEAMNMIRYQKSFDASAKMIQVADSMLDTVLNLKRF